MSAYLPSGPPAGFMRPRYTGLPHPPDGCPECVGHFAVVPMAVESDRQESPGVFCWYKCPRCGHFWRCAWGATGSDTDAHMWPDVHDDPICACGCGLPLLRSARYRLGGAA